MTRFEKTPFLLVAIAMIVLLAAWSSRSAFADGRLPVSRADYGREAHTWLSRGVVGEAGFHKVNDHIAIANVLSRRLPILRQQVPEATFVGLIREYMAGMGVGLKRMTRRQHYIRRLPAGMPSTNRDLSIMLAESGWPGVIIAVPQPDGWSDSQAMRWSRYIRSWDGVLKRMDKWSWGGFTDKCPNAVHWGAPNGVDLARAERAGWKIEDCGDTVNNFYSVPR